ncbi:MAG: radical SAM protein [Nanoarchaeota archaeon]|nr:radical SAM protein [Nanoarchaeota archaeon]
MKIALVNLYRPFRFPYLPLAIAQLNADLRNRGIKPEIIDFNVMPFKDKSLSDSFNLFFSHNQELVDYVFNNKKNEEISAFYDTLIKKNKLDKFDVVGFSISLPLQIVPALILSKKIKKLSNAKIVFGGAFNIGSAALTSLDDVDFIIRKYGEESFYLLIKNISGDPIPFSQIPGLVYKNKKNCIKNEIKDPSIDFLPGPSFEGFDIGAYKFIPKDSINRINNILSTSFPLNYHEKKVLVLPYNFMIGCPYSCFFCCNDKKNLQVRKLDSILNQIEFLSKKYKTRHFNFLNSTFNISNKFVNSFYSAFKERGIDITWNDSARPDINILSLETMRKLNNIGCNGFVYGIESGSQEILFNMNRRYPIKGIEKILKESKRLGMWVSANFIVGFPHESETQFNETLKFIKNNFNYIESFTISKFRLHPTSYIAKNLEKFQIKMTDGFDVNQIISDAHFASNFDELGGLSAKQKTTQQHERLNKLQGRIIELANPN